MMLVEGIQKVLVVGAGLMGHGIGQVFAQAGYAVVLNDLDDERLGRAVEGIRRNLDLFVREGLLTATEAEATLARITTEVDLPQAARDADLVVEATFEDLEGKRTVLRRLGMLCPAHTILTSNTSGLSVNAMAPATNRPDRFVVTHFWNPPHLIPLVEVVRGENTAETTIARVVAVLRSIDKAPVVVQKDVLGFVGNRLQYALFREALGLIQNGVCTAEDIDTVVKMSFGRRLTTAGPLETADLNGTDLFFNISRYLFPDLDNSTEPHPFFRQLIAEGRIGVKAGRGFRDWPGDRAERIRERRDRELIRWLKQDREQKEAP
ncbi:MAG TPA: 3-hydroxyacyl-CoA dehydrogenase family protein [Chloroflexota bacterium]|nr:3-hydroxyacyl-CoA dehydrogenase family protein [Chloroflexota bacterium]